MLILGIDPGIALCGYGIISGEGNSYHAISFGSLSTRSDEELPVRLQQIYNGICRQIEEFKPDAVAVEELFFSKNAKTAMIVGHARGVAVLAAVNNGLPVYEYTPLQIKQSLTGYGRADKNQIGQMVKVLLALKEVPKPDDTCDALAVSLCHFFSCKMSNMLKGV